MVALLVTEVFSPNAQQHACPLPQNGVLKFEKQANNQNPFKEFEFAAPMFTPVFFDVDNNGLPDLVVAKKGGGGLHYFRQDEPGSFITVLSGTAASAFEGLGAFGLNTIQATLLWDINNDKARRRWHARTGSRCAVWCEPRTGRMTEELHACQRTPTHQRCCLSHVLSAGTLPAPAGPRVGYGGPGRPDICDYVQPVFARML